MAVMVCTGTDSCHSAPVQKPWISVTGADRSAIHLDFRARNPSELLRVPDRLSEQRAGAYAAPDSLGERVGAEVVQSNTAAYAGETAPSSGARPVQHPSVSRLASAPRRPPGIGRRETRIAATRRVCYRFRRAEEFDLGHPKALLHFTRLATEFRHDGAKRQGSFEKAGTPG
jgi:hypothetical protein